MKKITSILMLFLMCFGMAVQAAPTDMPELSTDGNIKWYKINAGYRGGCLTKVGNDVKHVDFDDVNSLWYFKQTDKGVLMCNAAGGQLKHDLHFGEAGNGWFFINHGFPANGAQGLAISKTATISSGSCLDASNSNSGVGTWQPNAGDYQGTTWSFEAFEPAIIAEEIYMGKAGYVGCAKVDEPNYAKVISLVNKKSVSAEELVEAYQILNAAPKVTVDPAKTYVLKCAYDGYFKRQGVEKAIYVGADNKLYWNTVNYFAKDYFWKLELVADNKYKIQNVKTGKYLKSVSEVLTDKATAADVTLSELGIGQFNIIIGGRFHTNGHGSGANASGSIVTWDGGYNSCSAWYLVETNPDDVTPLTVNYNYYIDGVVVATWKATNQKAGLIHKAVRVNNSPYLKVSLYREYDLVSADNTTFNIDCYEELPFVKTTDKSDPHWYMIDIHGNIPNPPFWKAEGDKVVLTQKNLNELNNVDFVNDPSYSWCVMGNTSWGFKLYNKATGLTKALSNSDPANLVEEANAYGFELKATRSTGSMASGFCFYDPKKPSYLNHQGSSLKYWNDNDEGSTCRFYPVGEQLSSIADDVLSIPVKAVGSYNGQAEHEAALAMANSAVKNDFYNAASCDNLVQELKAVMATGKIEFNPAQLYRLKNVFRPTGTLTVLDNGELTSEAYNIKSVDNVWNFKKLENGNYNLINVNHAKGVSAPNTHNLTAGAVEYTIEDRTGGQFALKSGNYLVQYADGPGKISTWSSATKDGDGCWYFIQADELEVDMNAAGEASWSSLYLPFDVTLPAEGLEAFTGKLKGNTLSMTKVTEVPANNGVILKGTNNKYTLNIAPAKALEGENALKGTNVKKEITDKTQFYILGNTAEHGVGLYNPSTTTLKANKAYVEAAVAAQILKFDFNGEATGVEGVEVETENAKAVYYDLSGRRVATPAHGLYIKNGKKVYVK